MIISASYKTDIPAFYGECFPELDFMPALSSNCQASYVVLNQRIGTSLKS